MSEWDYDEWMKRRGEREQRFDQLIGDGALRRTPAELASIEDVAEFVELAYWAQRPGGGRLALAVAEPDALLERVVELAGEIGIREARLRVVCKPLSTKRLDIALGRLEGAGIIVRRTETRVDRRGALRPQRIWFHNGTGARTGTQGG
jgi:hypothetical protein